MSIKGAAKTLENRVKPLLLQKREKAGMLAIAGFEIIESNGHGRVIVQLDQFA